MHGRVVSLGSICTRYCMYACFLAAFNDLLLPSLRIAGDPSAGAPARDPTAASATSAAGGRADDIEWQPSGRRSPTEPSRSPGSDHRTARRSPSFQRHGSESCRRHAGWHGGYNDRARLKTRGDERNIYQTDYSLSRSELPTDRSGSSTRRRRRGLSTRLGHDPRRQPRAIRCVVFARRLSKTCHRRT